MSPVILSPKRHYRLPRLEGEENRWVVGDIHGCLRTLKHAVENILLLKKEDQLVLLGDYVSRGPTSSGVLDYIIDLQAEGYQVFPLLGNHEYNLLDAVANYDSQYLRLHLKQMRSLDLLDVTGSLPERYRAFLFDLPHYLVTEEALFVHGGFDFQSSDRFVPSQTMLELRKMTYNAAAADGRLVLHGHQPVAAAEIEAAFAARGPVLPLDAGCVYAHSKPSKAIPQGLGYLACLEMTEWRLVLVPNQEFLPEKTAR